jgi:hypothetical protein
MAYWTHYWKNKTVFEREQQKRITDDLAHTADDVFVLRGVQLGDVVYIVTVLEGTMHVLGRLVVDDVLDQQRAEKFFGEPVWPAADHLIAKPPVSECRYDVSVPYGRLNEVEFITSKGTDVVKFDQRDGADPHAVDRQALRGVREITASTAGLFDALLR